MGWGEFFGGIGKILGKVPIQGRRERWRNEIETLTAEKEKLLKEVWDVKKGKRIEYIDSRIADIIRMLKNAESE